MKSGCGSCNLCCRLLGVPDINKPGGMLCWWTGLHGGCQRHAEKGIAPDMAACAQFKCLWLADQEKADEERNVQIGVRPDICHVVLGPQDPKDSTLLYVQVDPDFPAAWRQQPIADILENILARGGRLEIIIGDVRVRLPDDGMPGGGVRDGMADKVAAPAIPSGPLH